MVRRNRHREALTAQGADVARPVSTDASGSADAAPAAPRPIAVPGDARTLTTPDDARALAYRLLTPGRAWPVAVVTVAAGQDAPYVDVGGLVEAVQGLTETVVLHGADVTWAFSDVMPHLTQVYGGASRVYPVELSWVGQPRRSPLRFAYSAADRRRVTDNLVADAMAAAVAAGLYRPQAGRPGDAALPDVTGTVARIIDSRALVDLGGGRVSVLWEELSGYGVPLDRLVQVGQRVTGKVDPDTQRFDLVPRRGAAPAAAADGGFRLPVGRAVLTEVVEATRDSLTLRPVPGTDIVLGREQVTTNELDRLDTLFDVGDVVTARVVERVDGDAGEGPTLSLLDLDDDEEPLPAPALLDGGPPWLVPPPLAVVLPPPTPTRTLPPSELPPPELTPPDLTPASEGSPVAEAPAPTPTPGPPAPRRPTPRDVLGPRGAVDQRPPAAPPATVPAPPATVPAPPHATAPVPIPVPVPVPAPTPTSLAAATERSALRDLSLSLDAAKARVAQLEADLAAARGAQQEAEGLRALVESLESERAAALQEAKTHKDRYRDADRKRQTAERKARAVQDADTDAGPQREWFTDPVEALHHAVAYAWARRVPAGEKTGTPLGEWSAGSDFVASLDKLGSVTWRRLAEVVADVVTHDPARLGALDHHELRRGISGNAPATVRDDGFTCFRVSLQTNSPSARRLHYWKRGDAIELSRVVVHDDFQP